MLSFVLLVAKLKAEATAIEFEAKTDTTQKVAIKIG